MWSDNETNVDLLGFKVHSDLIKDVVTDPTVLPVVLGVFGDWGGGKSSIMKMVQEDLEADPNSDVVCLYFNGWVFEGYEDAKTALLTSILVELGEHKRFGVKLKESVVSLLKRVQLMKVGKTALHFGAPLLATYAASHGLVDAVPAILAPLAHAAIEHSKSSAEPQRAHDSEGKDKKDETNWSELIAKKHGEARRTGNP